jgi:pimeloyl-ACP methyl ester carboxylesterase
MTSEKFLGVAREGRALFSVSTQEGRKCVEIRTDQGRFTAEVAGPSDGELVLLLHGFPQSRHTWRHQVPALAGAGYRAVAPDGRGYSPGVRPDPTSSLEAYGIDRLVDDVLDLAAACGLERSDRFHLVGHDWGGHVAWVVADRHPQRLASLTVLSRPHPAAFRLALHDDVDDQRHRSRHHRAFHDPATADLLLEDDARRLRRLFVDARVPASSTDEYLSVLGASEAIEAALAWYRAAGTLSHIDADIITVPTMYLWGEDDASVGRAAAEGTAAFVSASYAFHPLRDVGHFITDEEPKLVTDLLLAHLRSHPIRNAAVRP